MTEDIVKAEMRFSAIEYLLCEMSAKFYITLGGNLEKIEAMQAEMLEKAKARTFPGLPAEWSDLASAEFEDALSTLLRKQREVFQSLLAK